MGLWGLWSLMIWQFCHLHSWHPFVSKIIFLFASFNEWLYILIHLSCFFGIGFCTPCKKRSHLHGVLAGPLPGILGEGRRDLWHGGCGIWRSSFRFGSVFFWKLKSYSSNATIGQIWRCSMMSDWKSHRRCKMRHIAFSHDSWQWIYIKMPRWQWLKSCFVCRMKVAGTINAAHNHNVETSASVLQHQGLLHISIWNVFQLSIDQDGWLLLSFHFCMTSLKNGKTLSLRSENLWWFSRKPSVYIAIIYPNLLHKCRTGSLIAVILAHTFCNHQAGLGEIHHFLWNFVRLLEKLARVNREFLCQFGREALEESQFWLLIRAFQILLSSSPATNRSMSVLVGRSCVLKSQDHDFWRFPSFSKARAQAFSLFLADPPTRGIANGWAVYTCLGLTAVGQTLAWGLPFKIKWYMCIRYIYIYI